MTNYTICELQKRVTARDKVIDGINPIVIERDALKTRVAKLEKQIIVCSNETIAWRDKFFKLKEESK